MKELWIYM